MKNLVLFVLLFFISSCDSNRSPLKKDNNYYKCRLEIYCTRSKNSLIKKSAFTGIEIYFGTNLEDGICKNHYQAWGFDYRNPAAERCGSLYDFE